MTPSWDWTSDAPRREEGRPPCEDLRELRAAVHLAQEVGTGVGGGAILLGEVSEKVLVDLEQAQRGNQQRLLALDRFAEETGVGPADQVFDPTAGVDDIHSLSGSRSSGGSLGNFPRKVSIGSTGTSSILLPPANASTLCPG
jgi:hypothetical protein